MDTRDLLTIGETAARAGVSVPTLRFYETKGLVHATRTPGNQRRYARHTLRRLALVRAAQRFGLSLDEIREALDSLPAQRPPTARDWQRLSRRWHDALQARIDARLPPPAEHAGFELPPPVLVLPVIGCLSSSLVGTRPCGRPGHGSMIWN